MLIMTDLFYPKSQKPLKYKLAIIKLAIFNSLWYIYYEECFDFKSKTHFKEKYKPFYRA